MQVSVGKSWKIISKFIIFQLAIQLGYDSWFHPPCQEHHTHVVLVDAGSRREEAFGTEVDMREALERYATGPSFGIWSYYIYNHISVYLYIYLYRIYIYDYIYMVYAVFHVRNDE
jgi:hypothetical protein